MTTLLFLYLGRGILLTLITIPLYLQKVPPNGLYGFRVRKTMENPALWYPVNRHGADWLMAIGLLTSLSSTCIYFIPGLSLDAYALICLAIFVITFSIGFACTLRYMNSLS